MTVLAQLSTIIKPLGFMIATAVLFGTFFVFKRERSWDTIVMFAGALLSFFSQIIQLLPGLFYISEPAINPGEISIVSSGGPSLYPW